MTKIWLTSFVIWFVIILPVLMLMGCVHDDGWSQDEVDWIVQNPLDKG